MTLFSWFSRTEGPGVERVDRTDEALDKVRDALPSADAMRRQAESLMNEILDKCEQGGDLDSLEESRLHEFDLFTRTDRAAVIETLRQIIPTHLQHNWDEFHSRFEAPSPERLQQQQRARSLLRMALLAFAVAFGALGVLGAGAQYLPISAINVGVLIWLKFSSTDISGTTMPYPDSQHQTS